MKALIWIIIAAALIFGGYRVYKNMSAKPETTTEAKTAAASPVPETKPASPAPAAKTTSKPNSEKGIKNWRAVKKVQNLSDQHTKDLQGNM